MRIDILLPQQSDNQSDGDGQVEDRCVKSKYLDNRRDASDIMVFFIYVINHIFY